MKLINVTPKEFQCGIGTCPSIHKTDRGTYLVVGRVVKNTPNEVAVGSDEVMIEVPEGLLGY